MKRALVLGDAACVYEDAERAQQLFTPDAIAATNCIGLTWPHVDYWFTLHPCSAGPWPGIKDAMTKRLKAGLNQPQTWGHKQAIGIDYFTPDWGGSTGLLAVKTLMEMGFEFIVLAGVPLSPEHAHYYTDKNWIEAPRYRKGWQNHQDDLKLYVRSMSGWTKEFLGEPTPEWLGEK